LRSFKIKYQYHIRREFNWRQKRLPPRNAIIFKNNSLKEVTATSSLPPNPNSNPRGGVAKN
jgi:hypothetical protein